jgi:hypothetical protein
VDRQQSATFTISADTPEELARLLRRIADALDEAGAGVADPAEPFESWVSRSRPQPGWHWSSPLVSPVGLDWYRHRASDFIDRLTPDAAHAVSFIARHAPRVPVDRLGRELDKTPGPQLAGTLASIGYAWKALGAPEPPFRRVRANYEMDPDLAEVFQALLRDEDGRTSEVRQASSVDPA